MNAPTLALGTPSIPLSALRLVATPDPERLVTQTGHGGLDRTPGDQARQQPRQDDHDRPRQLVASFGTLLLEVLQGRRPAGQLTGSLTESALAVVAAWARQPIWRGSVVGSVRACVVNSTTVEGCLRLDLGDRSLMLTLRLEHRRGRWVVTDFAPLHTRGHLSGRAA